MVLSTDFSLVEVAGASAVDRQLRLRVHRLGNGDIPHCHGQNVPGIPRDKHFSYDVSCRLPDTYSVLYRGDRATTVACLNAS